MSETTFGCGEFLPGRGPFNFPDFIEDGIINNGGPGDQNQTGDPNPTTPPEDKECQCRPRGDVVTFPLYTIGRWKYFALQKEKECVEIINGLPSDNTVATIQEMANLITAIPKAQSISSNPGTEGACLEPDPGTIGDPEDCAEGNCDPIILTYRIPIDASSGPPPGPSTPGPSSPSTPQSGPRSAGNCKCTVVDDTSSVRYYNGGIEYTFVWELECLDRNVGGPWKSTGSIVNEKATEMIANGFTPGSAPPIPPSRCADTQNGGCDNTFDCGNVTRTYFKILSINVDPDTTPEPEPDPPGVIVPLPLPDDPSGPPDVIGDAGDVILVGDGDEDPDPEVGPIAQSTPGDEEEDPDPEVGPIAQVTPGNEDPGGGFVRIENQAGAGTPVVPGEEEEGPNPINPVAAPKAPDDPNPLDNAIIPTGESLTTQRQARGKSEQELISEAFTQGGINLSDSDLVRAILQKRPAGIEDDEVFFNTTPGQGKIVKNTNRVTNIFKDRIDESLFKLLENNLDYGDWDSTLAGDITPDLIYKNLNSQAKETLDQVLNFDGSPINKSEIFSIIGSRVLDGTINNVTLSYLSRLAEASDQKNRFTVTRSNNSIVNETVALSLIEKNYYPLDFQRSAGRGFEVLKNKKVFSSDVDKYIEVIIGGITRKYYVNDDDTFIDRSTLSISDGNYFDVTLSGEVTRLYTKSEVDHAYLIPEKTKQLALTLLGGETNRVLSVSGDPRGIEVDSSLSAPRQNIYFLSCVLDTIDTIPDPINPKFLKRTKAKFKNVPLDNIDQINEYIKYKDNHQVFVLDDEDLLFDYVDSNGDLFLEQTDILLDSPKENKTLPLLTRQYPWYILLYPSNKPENNPFNSKSQITDYTTSSKDSPETMTRQLKTTTTIIPTLRNKYNQFISVNLVGQGALDVFEIEDNDARINKLNLDNTLINSGYTDSEGNKIAASQFTANRQKTGFRLLSEIIKSLDTNYLLGLNGIGKSLTEFDVLSRLTLRQFNKLFKIENFRQMKRTLFNGSVNEVKVVPATKYSDAKIFVNKTQLVRKKSAAPEQDEFPERKSTNFGQTIVPPTTEESPTFDSFIPPAPPTALP